MIAHPLFELAVQFMVLALLSIGSANAIIPEIHRRVGEVDLIGLRDHSCDGFG